MLIEINTITTPLNLPRVAQSLDNTCGAACFDSMFKYFKGYSLGEMHFAEELDTTRLGFTPPINIVNIARKHGFCSEISEGANINDFIKPLANDEVIFVTWWDEDAGHYSLVKHMDSQHITLMDPWLARMNLDNQLSIEDFVRYWNCRGSIMIKVYKKINNNCEIY